MVLLSDILLLKGSTAVGPPLYPYRRLSLPRSIRSQPSLRNYSCGCLLGCVHQRDPNGFLIMVSRTPQRSHMSRSQLIDKAMRDAGAEKVG